ncbi:MAG TPA: hypothetical protein VJ945_00975 [Flavobacteriaceae bacterium]|nr:hypothetical protein [Flavobacteriaceae bacterium]
MLIREGLQDTVIAIVWSKFIWDVGQSLRTSWATNPLVLGAYYAYT